MKTKDSIKIKLLIKEVKKIDELYKSFNFSHKQQKYSLFEYMTEIFYVLKTGIAWRDLRSHINWNSVYKAYVKLNSFNIFEISYMSLLSKYLKKNKQNNLKYILTDTSFIPNKKGKDLIGYNKFYNRKNGTKISLITDAKGIVLNMKCYKGNIYDSKILMDHLSKCDLVKSYHIGESEKYFLADPGYDSKKIRNKLIEINYKPIIVQNKRNIKDKNKLLILSKNEKKIYKKRLKVENSFNSLKTDRKICLRYESKVRNFIGFVYLSLMKMLC
jgi:putative transposase